jgi:hypothetical protein
MIAQDATDALRFSAQSINGTARYTAMGGAFGALGGDISAIHINPASSAVFLTNKFSGSVDLTSINNDSFYGNRMDFSSTSESDFDLNQIGAVFVFETNDENALFNKLTLGFSYNRTNTFDDELNFQGNNSESISDYFFSRAQGVPLDLLTPRSGESVAELYQFLGEEQEFGIQQAFLGYEAFLFDANDPSDFQNTSYLTNVFGNDFNQNYYQQTRGNSGKYIINAGGQIGDRIHLGVNLNMHFLDYKRLTRLDEFNSEPTGINEIFFDNELRTRGSGVSLQIGGIAKVTEEWRLGFTYDSPTWMSISEELSQRLETVNASQDVTIVDPNVLNIYPDYNFRTPGKVSLSTAYVFGASGLLSFDYSYKDFSAMEFTSQGFDIQNQDISNLLTAASTYNIGGEYRIQNTSLRAGYFLQESPYTNKAFLDDTFGYSFGLGFSFGNTTLDFSYQYTEQDRQNILYQTGFSQEAEVQSIFNNYMLTLSFDL